MKRILLVASLVGGAMLLAIVGTAAYFRAALGRVEPFYAEALASNPAEMAQTSQQLESRLAAIYSEALKVGTWHTTLTAAEINSWLAVELPKSFPKLLPKGVRDPRVAIAPDGVTLAFQTRVAGVETVVAIATDVFVDEHGLLAIQLRGVRAGSLPLPTNDVVARTQKSLQRMKLPCHWSQTSGDPVLLVDISDLLVSADQERELETIELYEGEVYLAGRTLFADKRIAKSDLRPPVN